MMGVPTVDHGDATAIEVPEVLVNGLRLAVDKGAPDSAHAAKAEVDKLRERVPAEHRAAFDSDERPAGGDPCLDPGDRRGVERAAVSPSVGVVIGEDDGGVGREVGELQRRELHRHELDAVFLVEHRPNRAE